MGLGHHLPLEDPLQQGFTELTSMSSPIKAKHRKTRGWEEDKTSGPCSVVSDAQLAVMPVVPQSIPAKPLSSTLGFPQNQGTGVLSKPSELTQGQSESRNWSRPLRLQARTCPINYDELTS